MMKLEIHTWKQKYKAEPERKWMFMSYAQMSPLSSIKDEESLYQCKMHELIEEIILFRKALQYCYNQRFDDQCWLDYRHLLMRFLPGYDPTTDDVILAEDQLENCKNFIKCWQNNEKWDCLGDDKGKTIDAKIIGALDCLED